MVNAPPRERDAKGCGATTVVMIAPECCPRVRQIVISPRAERPAPVSGWQWVRPYHRRSRTRSPEVPCMSLRALARFCYRRRRLVAGVWIAALIGINVLASVVGTNFTTNFSAPNTESTRAANLLRANFKAQSGDSVQVVFEGTPSMRDPAVRQQ